MAGRAARVRKAFFGCFLFAFDLPLIFSVEWNQQRTGSPATWSAVSFNITITARTEFPKLPSRKKIWFLFDRLQTVSHRTVVLPREIIEKMWIFRINISLASRIPCSGTFSLRPSDSLPFAARAHRIFSHLALSRTRTESKSPWNTQFNCFFFLNLSSVATLPFSWNNSQ